MLLIPCPHCGDRAEVEFAYGGDAGVRYPEHPDRLDDEQWARFLHVRANPRGPLRERWFHAAGCRRWITLVRDTATQEIEA